jgi:hypothetical protein
MSTLLQLGAHFDELVGWRKEAQMVWPQVSVWTGVPTQDARRFVMKVGVIASLMREGVLDPYI